MNPGEMAVGRAEDWRDGTLREVAVGDVQVLVARTGGEFYAVGAACPHYGAPLAKGVLNGTRLMCPWHHACFDVRDGALQEPPALDNLPRYPVRVVDGDVLVAVDGPPASDAVPIALSQRNEADTRSFVIIGGGAAGMIAAQTLREQGYTGNLTMLSADDHLPYDRTLASKDYLAKNSTMDWMPLRDRTWYEQHDIVIRTSAVVTAIDTDSKLVHLDDNGVVGYDSLLIATGGVPIVPELEGSNLDGVFTLRSWNDADRIIAALHPGTEVAIVGTSFIGLETASSLRERGAAVTVIGPESAPFEKLFGPEIGTHFHDLHRNNKVQFRLGREATRMLGDEIVRGVELDNGEQIAASVVIVGVGVQPATDFVDKTALNDDGSITIDAYLRANTIGPDIWAAGDIARYPDPYTGEQVRIEHWRIAQQHGRTAARNMLGANEPFRGVPLFWSKQHGTGLRYVGHATEWDDVIVDGDLESGTFIAYYIKQGQLQAALGMQHDADLCALEECMRTGSLPTLERLRAGKLDWQGQMRLVEA